MKERGSVPDDLRVVYVDDRLLVLDKPPGLLSVPGIGPDKRDCLAARAAARFAGARIVHRLDRATSGVIVLALDGETHRDLSRQFEQRRTAKRYVAVASGVVSPASGRIDLPVRRDLDADGPRHIVDHARGRAARTHYRVLERGPDRTRLELQPVTGRSHQLRVHLQAIGHPILGDDIYAPPEVLAAAERLLLHAASLSLTHPGTGRRLTFEARCPF